MPIGIKIIKTTELTKQTIYSGVELGENAFLGDYVIIGYPPAGKAPGELRTIIGDNLTIRSHSVIYAGNTIGNRFTTGHHVTIRENNQIGDNVSIGTGSVIEHHIVIGHGCRFHSQVFIPEYTVLEDEVWIGPNVVLTNAKYPFAVDTKSNLSGIVLKKKARIGANVTILPGVVIGEDCLIGAGSVVTCDVEAMAVMIGNPARKVNSINNISHYQL
jgi:acetyltransferase-like isoleucine patch superfamily enzyme